MKNKISLNFCTKIVVELSVLSFFIQAFQHEIQLNQSRLEVLDDAARMLMQKCDSNDAANIQDDMDELHRYAQEVFARVGKFQRKLQRLSSAQVIRVT